MAPAGAASAGKRLAEAGQPCAEELGHIEEQHPEVRPSLVVHRVVEDKVLGLLLPLPPAACTPSS